MSQDKSAMFFYYWKLLYPDAPVDDPVAEYQFHATRKWRFDWAFLDAAIAVEIEGNAWGVKGGGRHMQDSDLEKYNEAAVLGWRVFRFSPAMLKKNPEKCMNYIAEALSIK